MSDLMISGSDALLLGHRDPTMSYTIIRTMVDTRLAYSHDKQCRKPHMTIRTRRDGKNILKSFCLAQNLSSFSFERLKEVVSELQKERYAALTHGKFKKTAMPQLPCLRRRIVLH